MPNTTPARLAMLSHAVLWLTVFTGLVGISLTILVLTLPLTQKTTQPQQCVERLKQ
tara:strand:- start:80 stop:247 length:168 start_codon:yes stop_codon:yes gene_type:complete